MRLQHCANARAPEYLFSIISDVRRAGLGLRIVIGRLLRSRNRCPPSSTCVGAGAHARGSLLNKRVDVLSR